MKKNTSRQLRWLVGGLAMSNVHEVVGVVAMLCSDEAGWCTGSVVCANGGLKFSY